MAVTIPMTTGFKFFSKPIGSAVEYLPLNSSSSKVFPEPMLPREFTEFSTMFLQASLFTVEASFSANYSQFFSTSSSIWFGRYMPALFLALMACLISYSTL